ncbi:hypothetical protein PVAP13_1NG182300 [Panicum virgatum]|uniref:GRF-type domain-containing protein n=1 Tax=Panicum virgatum TaxID=38727 RepID=A0A8T0WXY6_PANVG|nr:hypothetical protein PVAP13_1NG182300 [Panicum virgatum]
MTGAGNGSGRGAAKGAAAAASTRSKSVATTSPVPILIDYSPFICQMGRPCAGCFEYHERKRKAEEAARVATPTKKTRSRGGSSSFEDPFSESSEESDPVSVEEIPFGMEVDEWGGIDRVTQYRCRHGKRPRRMLCWDRANTGRRFLSCPIQARSSRCRFVKWIDDEWPAKFQKVACTLWDVVDQYKKKADEAKADFMGAIALRN